MFFVGAPKCGTTSLFDAFGQMGRFALPRAKEPIYFCEDIVAERPSLRENRLPLFDLSGARTTMHACHVSSRAEYDSLFESGDSRRRLDFCTFNFASLAAPALIHRHDPQATIVLVARDPLRRILSHYSMDRTHGYFRGSLEAELLAELEDENRANFETSRLYLRQTDYSAAWRRYRQYFPEDRIGLFVMEELMAGDRRAMTALFDLLGEPLLDASIFQTRHESNRAVSPRNDAVARLIRSGPYRKLRGRMVGAVPLCVKSRMRRLFFTEAASRRMDASDVKLPDPIKERIARIRTETEMILGRPVPAWRKSDGARDW